MEYKLLRALSIVLQAGLVILLIMLLSLVFLSCKPSAPAVPVKSVTLPNSKKILMDQRFINEVLQQRMALKAVCFEKKNSKAQYL